MNKDLKTVLLSALAVTIGIGLFFGAQYLMAKYEASKATSEADSLAAAAEKDPELKALLKAVA